MKSYSLKNVKAFSKTQDIELAPITIFVGQNSCGKSSFIRFPVLLHQAICDEVYPIRFHSDKNDLVDFGNFIDVTHNHNNDEFTFRYTYSFNALPPIEERICSLGYNVFNGIYYEGETGAEVHFPQIDFLTAELSYANFSQANNKEDWILVSSYRLFVNNAPVLEMDFDAQKCKYTIKYKKLLQSSNDNNYSFIISDATQHSISPEINKNSTCIQIIKDHLELNKEAEQNLKERFRYFGNNPHLKKSTLIQQADFIMGTDFPDPLPNVDEHYFDILNEIKEFEYICILKEALDETLLNEMKGVCYIGPFRNNPERIYRHDSKDITNVGKNGESAVKMLIKDKKVAEITSKWFMEYFGYRLKVKSLGNSGYYQLMLKNLSTGTESNIIDVGYGISQILPIISQIAATSINHTSNFGLNELYIIEQPELHLHPNAQASLAELFASIINNKSGITHTILIETHSEHFIRKLQYLIADDKSPFHLSAEQVKIYYVHGQGEDKDKQQKGSWIEEMKMDQYGQFLKKWPTGFFDKSYNLTGDIISAIQRRKEGKK